jgi:hypothetical protein
MNSDHIVIIHPNRKIKLIGEITGTSVGPTQNNITFLSNDVTTLQEIKQLFDDHYDITKFKKFDIIHIYGNFRGCFVNDFSIHNLFTEVTFSYDSFYEVDMNTRIMMKIEEYYKSKNITLTS